ncbi:hypothetical protein ZWY2020_025893 [Hordeum vulgare]|nr:hypothetical protein ZWY2020_025893 [Hordeum vulgare]
MPESFYTNGGLKLRVVWTISSLIAASTRHYLLRSIIKEHPTLVSLGATLVAIKPSTEGSNCGHISRKETDAFISGAFDGLFKFAAKALMKRRIPSGDEWLLDIP